MQPSDYDTLLPQVQAAIIEGGIEIPRGGRRRLPRLSGADRQHPRRRPATVGR